MGRQCSVKKGAFVITIANDTLIAWSDFSRLEARVNGP